MRCIGGGHAWPMQKGAWELDGQVMEVSTRYGIQIL